MGQLCPLSNKVVYLICAVGLLHSYTTNIPDENGPALSFDRKSYVLDSYIRIFNIVRQHIFYVLRPDVGWAKLGSFVK